MDSVSKRAAKMKKVYFPDLLVYFEPFFHKIKYLGRLLWLDASRSKV